MSDYTSTINFARREGRQEGIREGELKGLLKGKREGIREGELKTSVKIAKEMKANNFPFDTIRKYTGLSMEEIERLQ
jgi:predicted transposase/invertase (TIGR01784 family)